MTPALDAGDVVLRGRVQWCGETAAALRAKLLQNVVPAIASLLDRVRKHGFDVITRTPQGQGRYYTTPTWAEWREYRRAAASAQSATDPIRLS